MLEAMYSEWISGILGGLVGSLVTACVSVYILRKQFLREEKTIRETRASQIMESVETSIWTILRCLIYEHSLSEKFRDELFEIPSEDKRGDLYNNVSVEKMKNSAREQEAERVLIQQKALIELFIGDKGLIEFNAIQELLPKLKESIYKIDVGKRKIREVIPSESPYWEEYLKKLSNLREVLWYYADYHSFHITFFLRIKSKKST